MPALGPLVVLALIAGLAPFGTPLAYAEVAPEDDILPNPAAKVVITGGSKKDRTAARKAIRDWGAHTHIIAVTFKQIPGVAKAYTHLLGGGKTRIEMTPGLAADNLKSTLAHEIGHATISYLYRQPAKQADKLKALGFIPQKASDSGEEAAADCMEQVKTDGRRLYYMPKGCTATQKWMARELWAGRIPMKTAKAKIYGRAAVGTKLTADPKVGSWTAGVRFRYQWYRSNKAIKGATGPTYRVRTADVGKKISVRVTGAKAGYASRTTRSSATAKIATK
jgi:hypothetical protein